MFLNESLLESGKFSDLTIVCHGREFKVHKAILCPQSEVIDKLCDIDMREKRTGTIEHKEFDSDTMERMIDFVYKRRYEATFPPKDVTPEGFEDLVRDTASLAVETSAANNSITLPGDNKGLADGIEEEEVKLSASDLWVIHTRVYGLADYYDMPELHDFALGCFMQVAENKPKDISLEGFIKVAREVCKRTAPGDSLRAEFLSLVSAYGSKLAADDSFIAALCDPGLKDMTVEIFAAFGKRMVDLEKEKEEMASSYLAEKKSTQQSWSRVVACAERAQESAEDEMQRLIRSLESLPAACVMRGCNNKFGRLAFERGSTGELEMRCGVGNCRCRLH